MSSTCQIAMSCRTQSKPDQNRKPFGSVTGAHLAELGSMGTQLKVNAAALNQYVSQYAAAHNSEAMELVRPPPRCRSLSL